MVNWFCYMILVFLLKLKILWMMLSGNLLYFIKFSLKVLVKGIESDQAHL